MLFFALSMIKRILSVHTLDACPSVLPRSSPILTVSKLLEMKYNATYDEEAKLIFQGGNFQEVFANLFHIIF
jgi:hypothetical protein